MKSSEQSFQIIYYLLYSLVWMQIAGWYSDTTIQRLFQVLLPTNLSFPKCSRASNTNSAKLPRKEGKKDLGANFFFHSDEVSSFMEGEESLKGVGEVEGGGVGGGKQTVVEWCLSQIVHCVERPQLELTDWLKDAPPTRLQYISKRHPTCRKSF